MEDVRQDLHAGRYADRYLDGDRILNILKAKGRLLMCERSVHGIVFCVCALILLLFRAVRKAPFVLVVAVAIFCINRLVRDYVLLLHALVRASARMGSGRI